MLNEAYEFMGCSAVVCAVPLKLYRPYEKLAGRSDASMILVCSRPNGLANRESINSAKVSACGFLDHEGESRCRGSRVAFGSDRAGGRLGCFGE